MTRDARSRTWVIYGATVLLSGTWVHPRFGETAALLSQGYTLTVSQDRLNNALNEPQNWLLMNGDYASTRYSRLTQINRDNVKNLRMVWALALGGALVYAAAYTVELALSIVDRASGAVLWHEDRVTDYEDFTVNINNVTETTEREEAALRKLARDTARLVKERMLEGF